jgi:hypothetical protein
MWPRPASVRKLTDLNRLIVWRRTLVFVLLADGATAFWYAMTSVFRLGVNGGATRVQNLYEIVEPMLQLSNRFGVARKQSVRLILGRTNSRGGRRFASASALALAAASS